MAAVHERAGGWRGGAGCARAVDRPRQKRAIPSDGERTGRRARGPDPETGPAALRWIWSQL